MKKKKNKIALLCDSSIGISDEKMKKLNIHILNMYININGKEYIEKNNSKFKKFFVKNFLNFIDIKTSQPSIGDIIRKFKYLLKKNNHIIYLSISKKLSSVYNTALLVSEKFNKKITIIDSKCVGVPILFIAKNIKKMIKKGFSPIKIKNKIKNYLDIEFFIVSNNIKFLKKSGRVNFLLSFAKFFFREKKILFFLKKGKFKFLKLSNSIKILINLMIKKISFKNKNNNILNYEIGILNGYCNSKILNYIKKKVIEKFGYLPKIYNLPPIIIAHLGINSFALVRIKKINKI